MKKANFCVILAGCAIIQVTLLNYLKVFTVGPDLLLICTVIASLVFPLKWALFFCLSAGVFKDAFGAGVFGINTALFPLWGFLIIKLTRKIAIDNNIMRVLLIAVVTLVHNLLTGIIFMYYGTNLPFGILFRILLLSPLLAAIFSLPMLKFFKKLPQVHYEQD
ncbi:MAG: rod shape-determining protein MreD [Candidatus Omnitrophota bacterium]|jgi:rod shape-determining protein MreD